MPNRSQPTGVSRATMHELKSCCDLKLVEFFSESVNVQDAFDHASIGDSNDHEIAINGQTLSELLYLPKLCWACS
jgi:hypothetical protein